MKAKYSHNLVSLNQNYCDMNLSNPVMQVNHQQFIRSDDSLLTFCLNPMEKASKTKKTLNQMNKSIANLDPKISSIANSKNKNKIPIKNLFNNKNLNQFINRQKEIGEKNLNENKVTVCRRKFTDKEDDILKKAVSIFGSFNWKIVASLVPGRSPRQCRDRYTNYLAPGLVRLEWSEEEDKLLAEKYQEFGTKWTQIRQYFPARSANDIKNRYNYTVCHKIQKYQIQSLVDQNQNDETNLEQNQRKDSAKLYDGFIDFDDIFNQNIETFENQFFENDIFIS